MFLLFAFKGLDSDVMKAMHPEQTSLGLVEIPSDKILGNAGGRTEMSSTPAQDVYEIRPREGRDGFDLISDRFRRGPIWYAGPDAVRTRSRSRSTALVLAHAGLSSACSMNLAG